MATVFARSNRKGEHFRVGKLYFNEKFINTKMLPSQFKANKVLADAVDKGVIQVGGTVTPMMVNLSMTVGADGNRAYGYRSKESAIEPYGSIGEDIDAIIAFKALKLTDKTYPTDIVLKREYEWFKSITVTFDKDKTAEFNREFVNNEYRYRCLEKGVNDYIVKNNGKPVNFHLEIKE